MITIVGISGSTRRGSFNPALLRAAAPEGAQLTIESIAAADGLLLVTPAACIRARRG